MSFIFPGDSNRVEILPNDPPGRGALLYLGDDRAVLAAERPPEITGRGHPSNGRFSVERGVVCFLSTTSRCLTSTMSSSIILCALHASTVAPLDQRLQFFQRGAAVDAGLGGCHPFPECSGLTPGHDSEGRVENDDLPAGPLPAPLRTSVVIRAFVSAFPPRRSEGG